MPERTPKQSQETVDDLERKVFGHTQDQQRDSDEGAEANQPIDPSETTADEGGHTGEEPPA
ncbi:hypothetical protein [Thermocrispum municipale]|jgi:hypothetical protein|uniref:hypothetical protein n=1 Tax=Thermocrispum municipale TaxID=37926 RepID=UPI00040FE228|nr:hypothetical protein [Thermocrispum municipale]